MKEYLKELEKQAAAEAPMEKRAGFLRDKMRKARGYETKGGATYQPVALTLASLGGGTAKYPSTKPYTEKVLLPNAAVSPTIGIGMGGLQARIKINRRPDGVPAGSIIGQGLENQRGITSGADIGITPKGLPMKTAFQGVVEKLKTAKPIPAHLMPEYLKTLNKAKKYLPHAAVGAVSAGAGYAAGKASDKKEKQAQQPQEAPGRQGRIARVMALAKHLKSQGVYFMPQEGYSAGEKSLPYAGGGLGGLAGGAAGGLAGSLLRRRFPGAGAGLGIAGALSGGLLGGTAGAVAGRRARTELGHSRALEQLPQYIR